MLDAVKSGAVQGIVGVVGCNNPRIQHDYGHVTLVKELIARDILVVNTGCNAIACAKAGLLQLESDQARRVGVGLAGRVISTLPCWGERRML